MDARATDCKCSWRLFTILIKAWLNKWEISHQQIWWCKEEITWTVLVKPVIKNTYRRRSYNLPYFNAVTEIWRQNRSSPAQKLKYWAVGPAGLSGHWWAAGFTCHISHLVNVGSANFTPSLVSKLSSWNSYSKLGLSCSWLCFFSFCFLFFFPFGAHFQWQMVWWDVPPDSTTPELLFNLLLPSHVALSCSRLFIFLSEVCVLDVIARLASTAAKGVKPRR